MILRFWAALFCVALAFLGCMESSEKQANRLTAAGEQAFSQRHYQEAVKWWSEALQSAPERSHLAHRLGDASLRLARFDEAERYFSKAVELKPDAWAAWIEIGKLRVLAMDLQGGEEVWEILKARRIRIPQSLIYHGDLAMLKNEFGEAELDYREALAAVPELKEGMIKLAICLQVQKKDVQADAIFNQLASLEINDPLVFIQMGHFLNIEDRFVEAEKYMRNALSLDPADLRLHVRVANFYAAAGHYPKAAEVLKPLLGNASLAISKEYGNILIQLDKIEDAIAFLKPLQNDYPNDDALKFMMGKCHLLSGNGVMAISEFNAVAEKNPDSPSVHYLLGMAYLSGGYNQMGIQQLTRSLTLDNSFSDAELALAGCYYKSGEYALARQHAQRVMENEPANFSAYMIAGATYLEEDDFPRAQQAFAMAKRLNPDSLAPLYFSALADELAGQTWQAETQYERLLSTHPLKIDIAEQYRALLINNGQTVTAWQFLDAEATRDPDNAYLFYMLGDYYASFNQADRAMDAFQKAIQFDPGLTSAYLRLANLHEAGGDLDEAVQILQQAVAENPAFTEGMGKLAQLHCALGNTQEAIPILESAYAMNREEPAIINNLAVLYLEAGANLNLAFELAQKAYEKNSADPAFIDTLGWAYYKKGLFQQAAWYLKEADKLLGQEIGGATDSRLGDLSSANRERLAMVNYHLGMALLKKGNKQAGLKKVHHALEFGLDGAMREEALGVVEGNGGRVKDEGEMRER